MKWFWYFSVIALLLVAGCTKVPPAESESSVSGVIDSLTLSKNKEIKKFWTAYRKATKYRIAGSWQEAVKEYIIALEINNQHEDALYYLGNMYLELGQYDKAEDTWRKLLEVNPSSSRGHYQLGKLYLNKDATKFFNLTRAAQEFQTTTAINKDFIQPVLNLAQISLIQGDYHNSSEKLQTVLGSDNKNVEALFLQSYINFKQGDLELAIDYFKRAEEYSVQKTSIKGVKGEGETKSGESHARRVSQSIFFEYYKGLKADDSVEIEAEMQDRFTKMNNFIVQLQKL
jgi:tetratricopeptide (TPR) repeat protein